MAKAVMMDVARLAGVSHQTVSRVLNDHPSVREETRERVLAAMRQLDYRRNSAARTLVTRRSQTIGLASFDTTLVGPSSMVYAIERAAREAGYFVTIASAHALDENSMLEALDRLRDQSVEGIVALAPMGPALAAVARVPADMPIVGIGVGDATGVPMIAVDNVAGAELACRHLLRLGHPTVHHLAGPDEWLEAQERVVGWRSVLRAAGAAEPAILVGDWTARSGYAAGRVLAADPTVTAVFCANDQMALGVLRALHEAGRSVPGEVSVVGFDDIPEAEFLSPPLTTVRQDFNVVGREALRRLVEQLTDGTRTGEHLRLAPQLILRASDRKPARTP